MRRSSPSTTSRSRLNAPRRSPSGSPAVLAPSTIAREDLGGLTRRLAMALRIICMCGYVIQGEDDDELWRNAQGHMGVLHPELVGNLTRDDLLAQAEQL